LMNIRYILAGLIICLSLVISSCQLFPETKTLKSMQLYVTVDWEGKSLDDEDIEAMQHFRQRFPYIPMLQLLNPAYFLRGYGNQSRLADIIQSTFLPGDTQGLHIHAWKSLMHHCDIRYQYHPSFADVDENCHKGDCGYTVSLEYAYSQAALTELVACSNGVLVDHGFNHAVHFRAGGWQLGPKLLAALEANGFVWDSSQIDATLLTTRWHEQSGMIKMLRNLHPKATPLDQPFAISKTLMEYPNNAALADYTNAKKIVALFNSLINANKKVMVLGFHQETAADFLKHLEDAVPQMEVIAKQKNIQLQWVSQ
jgi:hypothetical protein